MRRYRRNSVENRGWSPLFFNEKPLFPPISHKKIAGKIFWYWCRKRRTQSENQISAKEKQKTWIFLSSEACCNQELRASTVSYREFENVVFGGENSPTIFYFYYIFLTNSFCLFKCIEPFLYCGISESGCLNFTLASFYDMSILFSSFESPLEATFSPRFLASGLSGAHSLTTSQLKT